MANENEKNPSALEELRRLKRTDRIKSLDIHEPELHDFNAENIFHIDEEPEKKTIFGKRSARTHVKINENIFDDEVAESVDITPSTSIEEVEAPIEKHVVEEPKVDDKPLVEEKPKFIEEEPKVVEEPEKIVVENLDVDDEPKKIVVEKLDVDDDFTTESIENELKSFNAKPIEEEQPVQEVLDDEEDFEDEYVDDDEGEDEDEDLYEERKKFLYAEYPKIEQYLQDKSSEGYHFVRQEGKKYFFRKGQLKTYYYSMNYFVDEPDADQWREWESDGWCFCSAHPAVIDDLSLLVQYQASTIGNNTTPQAVFPHNGFDARRTARRDNNEWDLLFLQELQGPKRPWRDLLTRIKQRSIYITKYDFKVVHDRSFLRKHY